jgi:ABC-type multidrug transport system ATPase subunit
VAEGLSKRPGQARALQGVDLEPHAGAVLGLPGPNGAGKAAVRILSTLLRPDAGRARVAVLSYRHTTAS